MKSLNIRPYFDDYDQNKQFYQILYRPGYPVQARELNQMQTILQDQIARHGRHVFKEGSMVIPGQMSIDVKLEYVKLDALYSGAAIDSYIQDFFGDDVEIIGETSGVRAKAIKIAGNTENAPATIWLKYISSGADGTTKTFALGETIRTNDTVPLYAKVQIATGSIGVGSSANIQEGVYFVNDRFILVGEQTIILDSYGNTPSYRVGLQIMEDFITPEEDGTLYDNAQGSTNFAAPGAHRYFIDLVLAKYAIDDTSDKNFIELIRVRDGVIESKVTHSEYSILQDSLARRTYDESGNYSVDPFILELRENRNNDRGTWSANTFYEVGDVFKQGSQYYSVDSSGNSGLIAPSHTVGSAINGGINLVAESTPSFNRGTYSPENGGKKDQISAILDPGKAYVYGYEIEKVGSSVVSVPKANTFASSRNGTIKSYMGSYVRITNTHSVVDFTKNPTVELRNAYTGTGGVAAGTLIGTARIRYMEYDSGTIGTTTCVYLASLFDIKMNNGIKFEGNVRQVYFNNTSGQDFTCDLVKDITRVNGLITTATSSAIVSGFGTTFLADFDPGDAIAFYNSGGVLQYGVVSTISSDSSLVLTANASAASTTTTPYNIKSTLHDANIDSMVFKLPNQYIRKLRDIDDEGISNISYYVKQAYTATVASSQVVISTASSSETFASPQQPDAFMVVCTTDGTYDNSTISLNGSSNVATITVAALHNGESVTVLATVKKTLKERVKTLVRGRMEEFNSQSSAQNKLIILGKADGIRILKVCQYKTSGGAYVAFGSAIPVDAIEEEITSRYIFSGGQKDAFYDLCSLENTTTILPSAPVRVFYDHYEHSSIGDYFTVDSYQKIIEPKFTNKSNEELSLYDCIDFRPTRTVSGFSASGVPAIGFDISSDYTYFLPRIDKLSVSSLGEFILNQGAPATTPSEPTTPENCMLLYTLMVYPTQANSSSVSNVTTKREENRRYTMRDIGAIEKRLSNVEYYTSLSLLEAQTKNLQLFDTNGDLSFKNGFLVDPLNSQAIADTASTEYRCSIDPMEATLRPAFSMENVKVFEVANSNAERLTSGYVNNSGVITLPYEVVPYATQPFATRDESVTPYIKINFIGDIKLTPSSDEWFDTTYKPDINIQQVGNFDAVVNQHRKELGTVWNSWQTTWNGTPANNATRRLGGWTTPIQPTNQQVRTGTRTFVKEVWDTKVVGDRVISIDIIPFIRPRTITFNASGLKPNSRVYVFMDQTNVSSYVNASRKIFLSGKIGIFDTTTSAGAASEELARTISASNNSVSTGLVNGDVIHNGTGGNLSLATATAVAMIDEDDGVRIVNIRGTFANGNVIYGTISGATGTITSIDPSTTLITNAYGEVSGSYNIPSNSQIRFRTGNRKFTLTDSAINGEDYTTKAETIYSATGYLENRQKTIVSTKNGVLARESVTETRTLVPEPVDPLAQSFLTPIGDGIFIDSVDLYFSAKDRTLPLFFEIREMENGIPTKRVLPGSRVTVKPSSITTASRPTVVTRIKTEYPVFLDGDTEYCFVLLSDSPMYRVWISQLGENDILTGQRIAKQPFLGTIFKSQNASTWTPDQMQDIKFVINRCKFDTGVSGNIKFSNQKLDSVALTPDAFYTKTGSSLMRIRIPNHGLGINSKLVINGALTTINGIAIGNINKTHDVLFIEQDYVVVSSTTNATVTGKSNVPSTETIYASVNVKVDTVNLISSEIVFPGTSLSHFIRPSDYNYQKFTEAYELISNENTELKRPGLIASSINEVTYNNSDKSLEMTSELTTSSEFLSPILDTNRLSLVAIGNRIDSNPTTKSVIGLDDVSAALTLGFSGSNVTASVVGSFVNNSVGQRITISGATNSGNNGDAIITKIDSTKTILTLNKSFITESGTSATVVSYSNWASEISPMSGTSEAKYIIKPMSLLTPADSLRIFLDVNFESPSSFQVYYRVAGNGENLTNVPWTLASATNQVAFTPSGEYHGVEYNIFSVNKFDSGQIKVVMLSSDTTIVPTFKQIRMIASS